MTMISGFKFSRKCFKRKERMALEIALNKPPGSYMPDPDQNSRKEDNSYSKVVAAANKIFGFNGWSYSVTQQTVDFIDIEDGRYEVGVSALVKVQLRDGTFHEDIGYGFSSGLTSKGESLAKARKMASYDALKNSLSTFGTGLCDSMNANNEVPRPDSQQPGTSYSVLTGVKRKSGNNCESSKNKKQTTSGHLEVPSNLQPVSDSIDLETTCSLLQRAASSSHPGSSMQIPCDAFANNAEPSMNRVKQERSGSSDEDDTSFVGFSSQKVTLSPVRTAEDEERIRRKIRQCNLELQHRQKTMEQLIASLPKYSLLGESSHANNFD